MQDLLKEETEATSLCSSDDEWMEESTNSPISDSAESNSLVDMEDIIIPSRFYSDTATGLVPKSRRALSRKDLVKANVCTTNLSILYYLLVNIIMQNSVQLWAMIRLIENRIPFCEEDVKETIRILVKHVNYFKVSWMNSERWSPVHWRSQELF